MVDLPLGEHAGGDPAFGPEPGEHGRGGEELRVRGQRPRRAGVPRADRLPAPASITKRPLAAPPPRTSRARSWSAEPPGRAGRCGGCLDAQRPQQKRCNLIAGATRNSARRGAGRLRPGIIHVYGQSCGHRAPKPRQAATGRKRPSKTALVLGGGGFTGGVYEIGALRALDLLAVNSTVNNFDVYVGTSAGSFVAAMLANGVTPDEMMQVINKRIPSRARGPRPRQGAEAQLPGFHAEGGGAAAAHRSSWRALVAIGDFSAIDFGVGLAEALPLASTPTAASPTTSRGALRRRPLNDFRLLEKSSTSPPPTSTPASGSSSARRAGTTCRSQGDQCSTALPILYKPVDLKGRHLVDGGIRSTTNVDIAVEQGAKFIIVVNPLVPYVNDFEKTIPTVFGTRVRRVADMGLPAIANQTFRLIAHARLHQAVDIGRRNTPASTSSWSSPSQTTS